MVALRRHTHVAECAGIAVSASPAIEEHTGFAHTLIVTLGTHRCHRWLLTGHAAPTRVLLYELAATAQLLWRLCRRGALNALRLGPCLHSPDEVK